MNIILTLITGLCISVMIYFNGSLESNVGNVPSIIIIHLVGFILTAVIFSFKREDSRKKEYNKVFLLAGVLGIGVVTLINITFKIGGVVLTLIGAMVGQVIIAAALEVFKGVRFTFFKTLSVFLVICSSIFLGYLNGVGVLGVVLSWTPGMLIFIQSYLNSKNIKNAGLKKTMFCHFGSVLIVLIPVYLIFFRDFDTLISLVTFAPLENLIGGGVLALFGISLGSYLLLKVKPVTYVLLLYCGQISGAIIIDSISGLTLSIGKIVGLAVIVFGLFLGNISKSKSIAA